MNPAATWTGNPPTPRPHPASGIARTDLINAGVLICLGRWRPQHGQPATARWRRTIRAHRAYHTLEPLWRDLHQAFPSQTPPNPGSRPRIRLAQRLVEIRDNLLRLEAWHTSPRQRHNPDSEANAIADALAAHHRGQPPRPEVPTMPAANHPTAADEINWLLKVADAYRHIRRQRQITRHW